MLNEVVAVVYGVLNGDTTLLNSGINPATGAARSVRVVGQGRQGDDLPLVRVTLDSAGLLEPDAIPHDDTTQPTAERVMLLVNVFSDFEPETRKIVDRAKTLLRHYPFETGAIKGYTWLDSATFYTDDTTFPDRVVRSAALRIRCTVEPI